MAIRPVPGYGGQAARNTIGAPLSIDQPLKLKNPGGIGGGLSGFGGFTPTPTQAASLPGTAIGSGGQTTTTTVTPLQVYQDQILSDPGSVAAQGSFDANVSNLALARRDAIQRAIINAGWDPSTGLTGGLASYAGDVDPTTLAAAAANPMSQRSQLQQQLTQANQDMPYDLAASGLDRSGAAAIGQSNLQQQYQTASYQGLQDLLGSITGAANDYAGGFNTAQQQLEAAREAIAARLAQNAGYSQVTTVDDGSGGDASGIGAAPGPSYTPYQSGSTSDAVQQVIKSLGIKKGSPVNSTLYQNIRNIRAG